MPGFPVQTATGGDRGCAGFLASPDGRATRRIDMLRQEQASTVGLSEGGRPTKTGLLENPVSKPTLASQGIDKNLAHQARTLGRLSEEEFEASVADARDAVGQAAFSSATLSWQADTGRILVDGISQPSLERPVYTAAQLARRWRRSAANVYIRRGELIAFRLGTLIRIRAEEVARTEQAFPNLVSRGTGQENQRQIEPTTTPERPTFMNLDEAASRLCIGRSALADKLREFWATRPDDPLHARIGNKVIISADDLARIYDALKDRPHAKHWPKTPVPMSDAKLSQRLEKLIESKRKQRGKV